MLSIVIHANELPEYEAKYKFDSKEISITGIREFKQINNEYEMQFKASNLFASMFFLSKFEINGDQLIPKTYDIKIRPKFLKRDQFINFNKEKCIVNKEQYNCLVLERYRNESNRTVKYYLAEELDFMFVKIIDKNPDRTNTLELLEILSFG